MLWGGGMSRTGIASVGGIAGAALMTSLASQGLQYLGGYLLPRGIGDLNRNVLIGALHQHRPGCAGHRRPAVRARGLPDARALGWAASFCWSASCRTCARSSRPRAASAMFFGTFNPFHNTHLAILEARDGGAAARQDHHPSDADSAVSCRRLPQGRDPRRPAGRRLPGLREDRQGRRQRRLFPDRQHFPAARDAQGADRAGGRRSGSRRQGRGGLPARDLQHARLPGRDRRDQGSVIPACACIRCTAPTSAA